MFLFRKKIDKETEEANDRWMKGVFARAKPSIDATPEYQKQVENLLMQGWSPGKRKRISSQIKAIHADGLAKEQREHLDEDANDR